MQWTLVRLELARTPDYPEGSASRAYALRLPLDDDGLIDESAVAETPSLASVRRFWPDELDQTGYLVRKNRGWAFSYAIGDEDDECVYHLEAHPIRLGEYLTITEPDGTRLPFRVAWLEDEKAKAA